MLLKRHALRIRFRLVSLFIQGMVALWGTCHATNLIDIYAEPVHSPIVRQIRFTFTIQNPTSKTLHNQVIWFYGPVKRTATQQVQKLEVSVPYELEEDALGNQLIKLSFDHFPPLSTKLVNIRADLLMFSSPSPSRLVNSTVYLDEERYIEKNDPLIKNTADAFRSGSSPQVVDEIYQWVRSNMSYAGYIADDLGARYAIANKRGDCTEYAYLVAALARANSIPARVLGGYVVDRNGAPKADEYHNWAEVHTDGIWHLVDAQKGNYLSNIEQYVATRIISQKVPNALNSAHRYRVDGEVIVRVN